MSLSWLLVRSVCAHVLILCRRACTCVKSMFDFSLHLSIALLEKPGALLTYDAIASRLGRTSDSIATRIKRLNAKSKAAGSTVSMLT